MIYKRQMKGLQPSGWALCWAVMFPPSLPSTRCLLLPGVLSSLPRAITKACICNKCFFLVTVLTCCMCLCSVLCVLFTSGATVILIFRNLVNSSFLLCLGRAVFRFGFAPNFAHCLRQFWRASLFNRWLGSSRRDAVLARSTGLSSSMSLIDRLRGVAQTIDGHSRQIMAGGLTTEAHSSPIPTYCSCCNQAVVPGTDHILWSCPTFDSYRRYSRPPDELEARLGWGQNGPKQHLIIQMGQIRAVYAEESVRLKKAVKFRPDSAVCIFQLLCNLMYLPCLPTPRPVQPEKTLFHCPLQVWEPWKRLEKKTLDARFMNTALLAVSSDISSALPVWDLPILVDICVSWLSQNNCFL